MIKKYIVGGLKQSWKFDRNIIKNVSLIREKWKQDRISEVENSLSKIRMLGDVYSLVISRKKVIHTDKGCRKDCTLYALKYPIQRKWIRGRLFVFALQGCMCLKNCHSLERSKNDKVSIHSFHELHSISSITFCHTLYFV